MNITVNKQNGVSVEFNPDKIRRAIAKSFFSVYQEPKLNEASKATDEVSDILKAFAIDGSVDIKSIQAVVIDVLENMDIEVANKYREYAQMRANFRDFNPLLSAQMILNPEEDADVKRENANKDANTIPVMRDMIAGEVSRYLIRKQYPDKVRKAVEKGHIHPHDEDYTAFPMYNCMNIDIPKILSGEFRLGNTELESPKSLATACSVLAQVIAQVASHIYGGNTIASIDQTLAPFVRKSFKKHYKMGLQYIQEKGVVTPKMMEDLEGIYGELKPSNKYFKEAFPKVWQYAFDLTVKECYDGAQSLEYEINTLHCANGQTPFSTFGISKGLPEEADLYLESKIMAEAIFHNRIRGIGKHGTTPTFPKLVYEVESGYNLNPEDPNYSTFKLAMKCKSLRMYPDILSTAKQREVIGHNVFPMGCRSFLSKYENAEGELQTNGRFNMGVVTISLPRVALDTVATTPRGLIEEEFYILLDKRLKTCKEFLDMRIDSLSKVKAKVAPILYIEGATGVNLQPEDSIAPLLENGRATISLGYIGLTETIKLIYGEDLHDSPEALKMADKLMAHLQNTTDAWKAESGYGFSLYATPSESLCHRFSNIDKTVYGIIEGINDKDYYTNSFHVDVRAKVNPYEKIGIEKALLQYSKGGHISFVELSNTLKNPEALEDLVRHQAEHITYSGTNSPTDHCFACDFKGEITIHEDESFECPSCTNKDITKMSIIRRLCGYLGEIERRPPNKGKLKEIRNRVKHDA